MGSTFFERVIDDVTCDTLGITEYQCGGKRGIHDNDESSSRQ